jgi:hypothetical protein
MDQPSLCGPHPMDLRGSRVFLNHSDFFQSYHFCMVKHTALICLYCGYKLDCGSVFLSQFHCLSSALDNSVILD